MSKLGVWLSHTLSKKNKEDCISVSKSLLSKQRNDAFLENIITGDEKWMFYDNDQCEKQWIVKDKSTLITLKAKLHRRKFMLSV